MMRSATIDSVASTYRMEICSYAISTPIKIATASIHKRASVLRPSFLLLFSIDVYKPNQKNQTFNQQPVRAIRDLIDRSLGSAAAQAETVVLTHLFRPHLLYQTV